MKVKQQKQTAYRNYEQEKPQVSLLTKVMTVILGVLMMVVVIFSILERVGYRLIQSDLTLMGGILVLVVALAWLAIVLVKKIKKTVGRIAVGMLAAIVIMTAATVAVTYVGQYATLILPTKYSEVTSTESGRTAVIMWKPDTGIESEEAAIAAQERMQLRLEAYEAEQAATGETDPVAPEASVAPGTTTAPESTTAPGTSSIEDEMSDEVAAEVLGFAYTAYPKAAGIFINERADVEGVIYKGYSSEAKILYEWLDADTLRIYLENPEVGDSGEIIVRF